MSWRSAFLVAGFAASLLTGCGFEPLYGHRSGHSSAAVTEFARISISPVGDRKGQVLRNALLEWLTPHGGPAKPSYRLDIQLSESRSDLVVLKDARATLAKMRLVASFALKTADNGAPLSAGRAESTTTFNIVTSEFANLSAERDARRRAVIVISDDIRQRLALYFRSRR